MISYYFSFPSLFCVFLCVNVATWWLLWLCVPLNPNWVNKATNPISFCFLYSSLLCLSVVSMKGPLLLPIKLWKCHLNSTFIFLYFFVFNKCRRVGLTRAVTVISVITDFAPFFSKVIFLSIIFPSFLALLSFLQP